ncbi:MAG TPA: carbohydrate ABC transporter permease [Bacilli bacterium]
MERELYLNPQELRRYKIITIINRVFSYSFIIIMAVFIVVPFLWMILSSVKTTNEIISREVTFFPRKGWEWANYSRLITGIKKIDQYGNPYYAFKPMPFHWMFLNTVVVGFFTTLGTVITTILAAFAFSRLNFKGRETIFVIMLATMMIPGEVFVITNYMTLSRFTGWIKSANHLENYAALIFPFITSVFYTFFLRQTFKQIPNELYLAAKVDGTSDFKYLMKVMIPLSQATITTIIILSMIGTWNAYIWPSFVTNANNTEQLLVSNGLMVGLRGASETTGPNSILNLQLAASTMVTVPLLIIFFSFKKYILRGVSRSGIKG